MPGIRTRRSSRTGRTRLRVKVHIRRSSPIRRRSPTRLTRLRVRVHIRNSSRRPLSGSSLLLHGSSRPRVDGRGRSNEARQIDVNSTLLELAVLGGLVLAGALSSSGEIL